MATAGSVGGRGGERKATKEGKDEGYYLREIAYGSFERAVALSEGAKAGASPARAG